MERRETGEEKKEDEREVRRKNGVKERKKKGRNRLMDPDNPQSAV